MKQEERKFTPPTWIPVPLNKTYFRAAAMTPEDWHKHTLETLRGCMTGEREEGSSADFYLTEWAERQAKASKAGKASANARSTAVQQAFKRCSAKTREERTEEERTEEDEEEKRENEKRGFESTETEEEREMEGEDFAIANHRKPSQAVANARRAIGCDDSDFVSNNHQEKGRVGQKVIVDPVLDCLKEPLRGVKKCPAFELWRFMARYCGEGDDDWTANTFKKRLEELGAQRFRNEAELFVMSCEAGQEPENRGAAFNGRLTTALEMAKVGR